MANSLILFGDPNGTRTRVTGVRGRNLQFPSFYLTCPNPLCSLGLIVSLLLLTYLILPCNILNVWGIAWGT